MPTISLIVIVDKNRGIGKDNHLLCRLPEDVRHFREATHGTPVIMGRKTWESLPDAFRPLPGRHNIVVSRSATYQAEGATVVTSLEEAIAQTGNVDRISIIGGADIFRLALPIANVLDMTEIDESFDADIRKKAGDKILEEANNVQKESEIESIAQSKGYSEICVYVDGSEANIMVRKDGFSDEDVVKLTSIATEQLKISAQNIKIVEVK